MAEKLTAGQTEWIKREAHNAAVDAVQDAAQDSYPHEVMDFGDVFDRDAPDAVEVEDVANKLWRSELNRIADGLAGIAEGNTDRG